MPKINIELYQAKINELGDWYQPISFIAGKLVTKSRYHAQSTLHGINKWDIILRRNLPADLSGKMILDLGCASGLYSMLCVRAGAQVIGVDLDEDGYRQSLLTREIFSSMDEKDYSKSFTVLKTDLMSFDWNKYGEFAVVMALNVLYWIKIPYIKISSCDRKEYDDANLHNLIQNIRQHSKTFLVQADENKYRVRKSQGKSVEATDSRRVVELLKQCGYQKIEIDQPIVLKSILRTIMTRNPEVDLKKPIYYARPVIKAESPD